MSKTSAIVLLASEPAKNELANCLSCLTWVNEIVLIADQPNKLVTSSFKNVVTTRSENPGFSKKRNQGAKQATGDWLLYIDLDERVTPELAKEIKAVIAKPTASAYQLNRQNYFLGQLMTHAGGWPDPVIKLIKKSQLATWRGKLHEQPEIKGKVGELTNPLIHLTHRDLESMTLKTLKWSKIEASNRLRQNHPPMSSWRFFRIVLSAFYDSFIKRRSASEGTAGTVEGMFQIYSQFMTYGRLWEYQQKPTLKEKYQRVEADVKQLWQNQTT